MAPHSHRRQVLLFLAAILLPCVALLADGRKVTYMIQTNEAEIWVMENLLAVLREDGGGR